MAKIADIEGIGDTYASKLEAAGIKTVEDLLVKGGEKKGRAQISEVTGIGETVVLNWVNKADLTRIKGVSTQYADLLEGAGVDTVPELATRNAANLATKMEEVNGEKNLVRKIPTASQVEDWVAQAKDLPRKVNH